MLPYTRRTYLPRFSVVSGLKLFADEYKNVFHLYDHYFLHIILWDIPHVKKRFTC
jgi:hypothetical protein